MYIHWGPDDEWDEMELDLDRDYAICRFTTEAGGAGPACLLAEQTRDHDRLDAIDQAKEDF